MNHGLIKKLIVLFKQYLILFKQLLYGVVVLVIW
jgi:hypothetical protein